jgi:hydrogenase expression/formation protein HypE
MAATVTGARSIGLTDEQYRSGCSCTWRGTGCRTRTPPEVVGACEILGVDPLYVANECKLVAVVAPEAAETALEWLRRHALGSEAAVIGAIRAEPSGLVLLETSFGGSRIVDMLVGDPLPRIC